MTDKILEFSDDNFDAQVLNIVTPTLVDFWATWCGPCKTIAPTIEELANEYHGRVRVGKLNVDKNPRTPGQFNVRSIPTLILFKEGQVAGQLVGARPKGDIKKLLDNHV
ncbi:MAG: thioredoxin [Nitrospinae bacterium RIFCSPLOWO2_12_FULL_45_22]|nr:MAG: thioredoxin [Nitrospinae bacterium RIFCSPLOWO2_12_FULL_45_22]